MIAVFNKASSDRVRKILAKKRLCYLERLGEGEELYYPPKGL